MSVLEEIAAVAEEATRWRRDLHRRPELLYALDETAALLALRLDPNYAPAKAGLARAKGGAAPT